MRQSSSAEPVTDNFPGIREAVTFRSYSSSTFPKYGGNILIQRRVLHLTSTLALLSASLLAQSPAPSVRILLPERPRLLQGQLVDLVLEIRNAASVSNLKVTAGDADLTSKFSAPVKASLDCDATQDWVVRANLQSFDATGSVKLDVSLTADGVGVKDSRTVTVRQFALLPGQPRNVILFIGDAMGTAYRDAARLVSRSIVDGNGKNSFRDGFFDDLLEMDKMPVSGMSMTYGTDSIVPRLGQHRHRVGDRQQELPERRQQPRRRDRLHLALYRPHQHHHAAEHR